MTVARFRGGAEPSLRVHAIDRKAEASTLHAPSANIAPVWPLVCARLQEKLGRRESRGARRADLRISLGWSGMRREYHER
jgi:hypothetical protein